MIKRRTSRKRNLRLAEQQQEWMAKLPAIASTRVVSFRLFPCKTPANQQPSNSKCPPKTRKQPGWSSNGGRSTSGWGAELIGALHLLGVKKWVNDQLILKLKPARLQLVSSCFHVFWSLKPKSSSTTTKSSWVLLAAMRMQRDLWRSLSHTTWGPLKMSHFLAWNGLYLLPSWFLALLEARIKHKLSYHWNKTKQALKKTVKRSILTFPFQTSSILTPKRFNSFQ